MARKELLKRLAAVGRRSRELAPSDFETQAGTAGERSRIARLQPETVLSLQDGRNHPLKLAIPTREEFSANSTAGDTETFTLGYSIADCPDTQSVVVWEVQSEGNAYLGEPDAIDYDANTIDVTSAGMNAMLAVFYISDAPATIEIEKATTNGTAAETLFTGSIGLIHATNQNEQPEVMNVSQSDLQRFVAADMTLDVYVDAPYQVEFVFAPSEQSVFTATNGLLSIDVLQGEDSVPGLSQAVKQDMSRR